MLTTILAAIPQPPVEEVMPKTAEMIFNVFIFIPLGIALALAVRNIVKGKGPLVLYSRQPTRGEAPGFVRPSGRTPSFIGNRSSKYGVK